MNNLGFQKIIHPLLSGAKSRHLYFSFSIFHF